jgi:hypothetical protein
MVSIVPLSNFTQFAAINLTADGGYDRNNRIIPNTAQIRLRWALADGKVGFNVLHGSYQGAFHGSQTEANAILTGLTTGANWTALALFMGTATGLTGVDIRDLNVANAPIIPSIAIGANGTSVSTTLPSEVAAVITLRTAFVGRQNRGRVYVPNWSSNAVATGDVIAPAAVTALGNWGSIIAGTLQAQGYIFGIGHFHRLAYTSPHGTNIAERPAGLVPITTISVKDNHWDSMRRRGLK